MRSIAQIVVEPQDEFLVDGDRAVGRFLLETFFQPGGAVPQARDRRRVTTGGGFLASLPDRLVQRRVDVGVLDRGGVVLGGRDRFSLSFSLPPRIPVEIVLDGSRGASEMPRQTAHPELLQRAGVVPPGGDFGGREQLDRNRGRIQERSTDLIHGADVSGVTLDANADAS